MRHIMLLLLPITLAPFMTRAQVPAADNATGNANSNMNWTINTGFDAAGNTISQSKSFYDISGRLLQTQAKMFYRANSTTVYPHVLATQSLRDVYGREVGTTLPAPIDYADFNYMGTFLQATDGSPYTYKNFDRFNPSGSGETDLTNAPQSVGGQSTKGTLGWYYGSNNTWEPYVPTSNYPYARKSIYRDGTNNDKRQANYGEAFVMGGTHESSSYVTAVNGELSNYLLVRNRFFTSAQMGSLATNLQNNAVQVIKKDANGNEVVSVSEQTGKVLLKARPGSDMTFTNSFSVAATPAYNFTQQITCVPGSGYSIQVLEGGSDMNIYMLNGTTATMVYSGSASSYPIYTPISGSGTLIIQSDGSFYAVYVSNGTQYSSPSSVITGSVLPTNGYFKILADNTPVTITGAYTLYDMSTEAVTSLSSGQLNRGYYKVVSNSGISTVTYNNGYTDVNYFFYNSMGQMIASVPPNGVKLLEGTGYTNYATLASIPYISLYTYDAQGRCLGATTPDAGANQIIYRADGNIRFSQNALQATTGAYSYTTYDPYGRVIENGQYQPDAGGIAFNTSGMTGILENTSSTGGLTTGTKTDVIMTSFDLPDNTHGQSGYVQDATNLSGAVSTSKRYSSIVNNTPNSANLVNQTWYNYDEEGKLVWTIKYIPSLGSAGYKTTDLTYDAMSRLTKKVFQKNVAAETFVHYYQYDPANGSLWKIFTNTIDDLPSAMLQLNYIYYLHGGLKRTELATNLQGMDYVYTLQKQLKAINNSNGSADPGNDAVGTNGFTPDAFGEVLDYFTNDYVNSRTAGVQSIKGVNTSSIVPVESYIGNIKAMSWFSTKPSGSGGTSNPTAYVYNYDPKYQFIASTWGTGLNFAANPATFTSTSSFQEKVTVPGSGTPGTPAYDANGNIQYLQRSNNAGTITDQMAFTYAPNTNRLTGIANTGTLAGTYSYTYDQIGREISDNTGGIPRYLQYNAMGKVTLVANDAGLTQPLVRYVYDELGQKIEKLTYNTSFQLILVTYYFDDAVYTQTVTGGTSYGPLTAQEYNIAGGATGRVGVYFKQSNLYTYELADHQGNIRAVIAKTGAIQTATDYYPFGLAIANLGSIYRYGYQGKNSEADPETGWNNFDLRMYNPRIGRWSVIDPKGQYTSPYEGMGNDPVNGIDRDGGTFGDYLRAKWFQFWHGGTLGYSDDKLHGKSYYTVSIVKVEDHGEGNYMPSVTVDFHRFLDHPNSQGVPFHYQPYFGKTLTIEKSIIDWRRRTVLGDKVAYLTYSGYRTGTEGIFGTFNVTTLDNELRGYDFTSGPVGLGYDVDGSVSGIVKAGGAELHVTISPGPGVGGGGSYTSEDGVIHGADGRYEPGETTKRILMLGLVLSNPEAGGLGVRPASPSFYLK